MATLKQPSVLPGFGLTFGFTTFFLTTIVLIPLALRGVKYRPMSAAALLRRNLLVYGVGGVIAPFPGIWLIDRLLGLLHLA